MDSHASLRFFTLAFVLACITLCLLGAPNLRFVWSHVAAILKPSVASGSLSVVEFQLGFDYIRYHHERFRECDLAFFLHSHPDNGRNHVTLFRLGLVNLSQPDFSEPVTNNVFPRASSIFTQL
ncbi:hypothetical protein MNV49_001882 [Pseudohyphozyma bogoriensis]|nr:hypothetical protein MNV49_001882 [Pseudohyphozyma bogoriensis]